MKWVLLLALFNYEEARFREVLLANVIQLVLSKVSSSGSDRLIREPTLLAIMLHWLLLIEGLQCSSTVRSNPQALFH